LLEKVFPNTYKVFQVGSNLGGNQRLVRTDPFERAGRVYPTIAYSYDGVALPAGLVQAISERDETERADIAKLEDEIAELRVALESSGKRYIPKTDRATIELGEQVRKDCQNIIGGPRSFLRTPIQATKDRNQNFLDVRKYSIKVDESHSKILTLLTELVLAEEGGIALEGNTALRNAIIALLIECYREHKGFLSAETYQTLAALVEQTSISNVDNINYE
jgi:hypothetical protein